MADFYLRKVSGEMKKEPELGSNIWFLASFFVFQAGSSVPADSLAVFLVFESFRPLFFGSRPHYFLITHETSLWENLPFYSATVITLS